MMRINQSCIGIIWAICLWIILPKYSYGEYHSPRLNEYNIIATEDKADLFSEVVISITGLVTDSENEPLIGVNVQIQGTTIGTSTDLDGGYSMYNVEEDAVLIFSYVGYQTQEIPVNGRSVINVQLESDAQLIDELVVVGYGTQRTSDMTGSVAKVDIEDLELASVSSFDEALAGRGAGVGVVSADSKPGGRTAILVRGVRSMTQGTSPLYVADGLPLAGLDPKTQNPED